MKFWYWYLKNWKAEQYYSTFKWTRPKLYAIFQSKGFKYNALFKHDMAAILEFFP